MNTELLGFTFDVLGKIMVAFTAIMVHHRFRKEHKVDEKVFRSMRREQIIAIVGIVLIVIGYLLQLPSKL
jgi:heme/copper-type cytochrome/quinol oxidase subunit 2